MVSPIALALLLSIPVAPDFAVGIDPLVRPRLVVVGADLDPSPLEEQLQRRWPNAQKSRVGPAIVLFEPPMTGKPLQIDLRGRLIDALVAEGYDKGYAMSVWLAAVSGPGTREIRDGRGGCIFMGPGSIAIIVAATGADAVACLPNALKWFETRGATK